MNVGFYQSASALNALQQWQETISQNIAASSNPGAREGSAVFESKPLKGSENASKTKFEKMMQGANPVMKTGINFSEGGTYQTQDRNDFAIGGKGFFEVQSPSGDKIYTRNGQFHFNAEGVLVSKEGYEVQSDGGSINMQNNGQLIRVTDKGEIFQGDQQINKLAVKDIDNPEKMIQVPGGFTLPKDGTASATTMETPKVLQGYLESSNISAIKNMTNLIQVSHMFEANQKVITTMDNAESQAIQILGSIR